MKIIQNFILNYLRNCQIVSLKWFITLQFPPVMGELLIDGATFLPILVIILLFYSNHSSGCDMVSHCTFLMTNVKELFMLVAILCIFFGEMPVHVLCPFFNLVICPSIIELCVIYIFQMQIPQHMYDLKMISQILWIFSLS